MEEVRMEYYTASWCGPCRSVRPIVEELQSEGWNIEKIDVDQNKELATKMQIMGVPTFVIYKNGQAIRRFSGARAKAGILGELKLAVQA